MVESLFEPEIWFNILLFLERLIRGRILSVYFVFIASFAGPFSVCCCLRVSSSLERLLIIVCNFSLFLYFVT